ncbi:hypothetical protein [Stackebrandtia nassauensis]|uniref:Uncharacterized protein n=1 Tax=Stackebrandtia nassauensis (strain DSM 44728 / CIP 108903 / NRRL B-16338 / NBRC 102104 / LLR-40K-21) TaxID=446470 RepID=D3PWE4_STANL|nr:hypothetical protein [Stackebrandtia nassauensis]ADD41301.1 hypothetical protein Snas_1598 [Stackebrandtia nassauensis DSM 44728]
MSDIETLGARVRGIAAELPVPDTQKAEQRLAEAHAGLSSALRESVEPAGIPQLARAREHVSKAMAVLSTASDNLDEYLISIGLNTAGNINESTSPDETVPVEVAPGSADWWRERVNTISEGDAKTEPGEVTVTRLFSELVERARRGDRDGYRDRLLVAGAGNGSKLPGLSWPLIRNLTADILGHAPTPKDDDRLRGLVRDPVRRLLPKLPEDVTLSQLHGACSLPHVAKDSEGRETDEKPHPADTAATGPAIVAALLSAREKVKGDR